MRQIILLLPILFLLGCANTESNNEKKESFITEEEDQLTNEDYTEVDLSWVGTYSGYFPCDDCDAIYITLTLNEDESYERLVSYMGKDTIPDYDDYLFIRHFSNTILLTNENFDIIDQYEISGDTLYKLDGGYRRLTGKNADQFILLKN